MRWYEVGHRTANAHALCDRPLCPHAVDERFDHAGDEHQPADAVRRDRPQQRLDLKAIDDHNRSAAEQPRSRSSA
jgi:hypothetical protein